MSAFLPLLLAAFIAGYWFCGTWRPAKYDLHRTAGHRLYFRYGRDGILITAVASFLLALIAACLPPEWAKTLGMATQAPCLPLDAAWWDAYFTGIPSRLGAIAAGLAILFAWPLAWVFNRCSNETRHIRAAYENGGRHLDRLLYRSQREQKPVQLTMDSGKVYVGWVRGCPDPSEVTEHLRLLPVRSGYRRRDKLTVEFTTDYSELTSLSGQGQPRMEEAGQDDYEIVLPSDRVVAAHIHSEQAASYFMYVAEHGPLREHAPA